MPQFKSLTLSNKPNNEAVTQCSAYGKLSVNLTSKDDRQQNISFKANVYQGDKIVQSIDFFSLKLELPRLAIGHYLLEIIPKRDETFFSYKKVELKDFFYNFEIIGDKTTLIECIISREESIIYNIKYFFFVKDNNKLTSDAPWYESPPFEEVTQNISNIQQSSQKFGIDEDLLKSIIYMESTHGYYDRLYAVLPKDNKSIRPTNINVVAWSMLFSRAEANDPAKNIDAGAYMLHLISDRVPDKDILKIASLYNSIKAEIVFKYGLDVKKFYNEKPWSKPYPPKEKSENNDVKNLLF